MLRLPFEAFLALRYLRPRRTFVSVITVISIIGVLLGVAVLIVVIAVMSGFDQEWRDRILGFNAHLTVFSAEEDQTLTGYQELMKTISSNKDVVGVSPIIMSQVLVKTEPDSGKPKRSVPWLSGVDSKTVGSVNVLPSSIKSGSFDLTDRGVIVGVDYANQNRLDVGDRIAIYSPRNLEKSEATAGKTNAEVVLPEEFTVRGIFDVGFPDFNAAYVVVSLKDARELLDLPKNTAQGLEVKLRDPFLADSVAGQLRAKLKAGCVVKTWEESTQIFQALATEKEMMFYMLFFIMIVAAFGIVNCQITFVVQKTREIGILKALGASNLQVLLVFLSQSVFVGVLGVGLGLGAALLALHYRNEFLALMRNVTGSSLLPPDIYHVYDLPALIQIRDVARICGTAFAACVLAGLFPAWKASRLQPVEALRHE
jgi:lipoprotein-releasing system permease protein